MKCCLWQMFSLAYLWFESRQIHVRKYFWVSFIHVLCFSSLWSYWPLVYYLLKPIYLHLVNFGPWTFSKTVSQSVFSMLGLLECYTHRRVIYLFYFMPGCNLLRNCHGFAWWNNHYHSLVFLFLFILLSHPDKKNCNFIWFIQRVQSVQRHNERSDNQYFPGSPSHPPNILKMKLERLILYAVLRANRKLNENVNERCFVSPK